MLLILMDRVKFRLNNPFTWSVKGLFFVLLQTNLFGSSDVTI